MVWYGSTIFSTNRGLTVLSKYFFKSLLLVVALVEKLIQKAIENYPEPWD